MSRFLVVSLLVLGAAGCTSSDPVQPSAVTTGAASNALSGALDAAAPVNQQLVFQDRAGTGTGTFNGSWTPFGFWIWCQTPLNDNAYGNDCAGSMYFYKLGITTGVDGSITSTATGYSVTVSSTANESLSNCTFTLTSPFSAGATNSVSVSCAQPAGAGTDSKVAIQTAPASK